MLCFLALLNTAQAQTPARITIRGIIQDTSSATMAGATVMLLQPKDSSLVNFSRANDKGIFEFKNVKNTNFILKVSFVGFLPYQQLLKPSESEVNDLGGVKIKPIAQELLEVVVRTAKAPLSIRGDTIEYNASSFKVPPGSSVEDLLRRLPGIDVDASGNIKAQGKDVKKLLVDGKTFFGNDPKAATKNLGAETISKVQVFNGKSEQALITGIDDGKKEKTINLELKEEFKKGAFGKVTAAIGSQSRTAFRGNYNRFNKKEQFSIIGYGNNINETGVNWSDYTDFKGNNAFNQNDNADFGFGNGNQYYFGDNNGIINNFDGRGFTKNFGSGINYNYSHEKTKFSSSYFYNQTKLNLDEFSSRKTFLSNGSFNSTDTANTANFRGNHSISTRFEQMLDSSNTLITKVNVDFNNSNKTSLSRQQFSTEENITRNTININNNTELTGYNLSTLAIFRHKFKKKGQVIASSMGYNLANSDGSDHINSLTKFFQATDINSQIRAIAQLNQNASKNNIFKAGLNYLDPLSKRIYWESFYNFSINNRNVGRDAFNEATNNSRLDSLSLYYQNTITYNRIGSSLRYSHSGINISAGVAALRYGLNGKIYPKKSDPIKDEVEKTYDAIVPNLNASVEFKNNAYLNLSYDLNINAPNMNDLQPVVNNNNPFYIITGNQDLLPEKSHSIGLDFYKFDPATFTNISIWTNYNYYLSQVTYNQTVDNNFITRTRPENISGGQRFSGGLYSNFPIVKTKLTLNFNLNTTISNLPTFINGIRNQTNNNNYSGTVGFNLTPSEKLLMNFNYTIGLTNIKYSIEEGQNQQIKTAGASGSIKWNFISKTFFETSLNYNNYRNDRLGFNRDIPILDCSIRRLLFKDNKVEVRLAAFDVFNKRQTITQQGYQNYVTNQTSITLARYFMLSLTYNMKGHVDKLKKRGSWL